MIIGKIDKNMQQICLFKDNTFLDVAAIIKETNFELLDDGVYEVDGKNFYYIIETYETKAKVHKLAEAHKKYIDFHYIIFGEEIIGYAHLDDVKSIKREYLKTDDSILFCDISNESYFNLKENMYAIFFPCDVHRPGIKHSTSIKVKKVIFKILT